MCISDIQNLPQLRNGIQLAQRIMRIAQAEHPRFRGDVPF